MNTKDIIVRLSKCRTNKNMSARELSMMLGKHEGYINKLESYDFNLTVGTLLEILEALEVSPEEFFAVGDDYNAESLKVLRKLNKLSEANKRTILDLIDKLQ